MPLLSAHFMMGAYLIVPTRQQFYKARSLVEFVCQCNLGPNREQTLNIRFTESVTWNEEEISQKLLFYKT